MSTQTLTVQLAGRWPISLVLPADEVVVTTLVVSQTDPQLPTITSVEHINGRLGEFGVVLKDATALDQLAQAVNVQYLSTLQANVETQLVDSLRDAVGRERSIWEDWPGKVARLVGKTALDVSITQLVGIPLTTIVRHALAGIERIV
ncbi:hypothetical protein [Umezawaea tangerina]|uniref:Uncharacterized protein n=1 Tax=Umezawaea tangerina TaxID=84725 RepID=A0A2T0T4A8_9PSEU|nr:hypothetical protein [Umezawaea tangerina]PRY40497.1 hypothetical protein CLV43_106233 [Umezawaea tangerina]